MEYQLVDGEKYAELEKEVNNLIKQGWKPLGGVCSVTAQYGTYFIQAMVK